MATLKFLTWNVCGMRDLVKRSAIFSILKKQRADIAVLVETHAEGPVLRTFKRPWIGWAYHSVYTAHSRRLSIIISKTTHFELQDSEIVLEGRFVFLKVKLHGEILLLLAFYVPPPFSSAILTAGFGFMALQPSIPVVWLGDFNNVHDPNMDRLCRSTTAPPPAHPTWFARMLSDFNLIDTWRSKNPTMRSNSCFSPSHHSMSRIDLVLLSQFLLPRLVGVGFSSRSLSDHCPYWTTLSLPHNKPPVTWRLNPFWLTLFPEDDDIAADWEQCLAINEGTSTPQIVWDTFKLHARMTLTTRINKIKRTSAQAIDKATEDLITAGREYLGDPTIEKANAIKLRSRVVDLMHYEKSKRKLFFHRQKSFEHGERAGKLLAYLVHCEERPPVVISLRSPEGTLVREPSCVTSQFRDFFTTLYATWAPSDTSVMVTFLSDLPLPLLTEEKVEELEAPLMADEISGAIAEFHGSVAPGSDDLPVEFYSTYSELLVPKLLSLNNSIFETSELPASMCEATIVLIPKPGKDPHLPESYRPISLLKVDVKILDKVLAIRLNKVILSLIHGDQAGFMPRRNTSFNHRRLFINLRTTHDNPGFRIIVALDTAKAFNSGPA